VELDCQQIVLVCAEIGYLYTGKHVKTTYQYRIIKAVIDASQAPICFVSNLLDESAYAIAACYKQRWEIEIFSNSSNNIST
jgi:IS4 transposase